VAKVSPGGCFTAHNVGMRWDDGIGEFLDHLQTVQDGRTTIDRQSRAGLSITLQDRPRAHPAAPAALLGVVTRP
jgi:hypothetical protein